MLYPDSNQTANPDQSPRIAGIFLGFAVFVAPLIFFRQSADPAGPSRLLVIQGAVTVGTVVLLLSRRMGVFNSKVTGTALFLLVWALLSLGWATDKPTGFHEFLKWLTFIQVFFVAGLVARDSEIRDRILQAAVMSSGIVSLVGSLQACGYEVFPYYQLFAPAATFVNRNPAAEFTAALFPLCLMLLLWERHRVKTWIYGFVAGLNFFFIVVSHSRAAWIAVAGTLFATTCICFFSKQVRAQIGSLPLWSSLTRLAAVGGVVFLLYPATHHQNLVSRAELRSELQSLWSFGLTQGSAINTVAVRMALLKNSTAMVVQEPLLGTGVGNFPVFYPLFHRARVPTPTYGMRTIPERVHNDLLQIFVELGIPGGLAFLALLGLAARNVTGKLRASTSEQNPVLTILAPLSICICLLLNSLFAFPLKMPVTGMLFWMAAGFLCSIHRVDPKNSFKHPLAILLLPLNLLVLFLYFKAVVASSHLYDSMQQVSLGNNRLAYAFAYKAYRTYPPDWYAFDHLLTLTANYEPDRAQAQRVASSFLARRPHSPNGHLRNALILKTMGRHLQALEAVNQALRLGGESSEAFHLRSLIHGALGDQDAARIDFSNYESAKKRETQRGPAKGKVP